MRGLIEYSFDTNIGFISKLVWMETEDLTKLEMMFSGQMTRIMQDAYFVRAYDLRNEVYQGNDGEVYDSIFLNNGHPSDGDFDHLYIYLDVEITSSSIISRYIHNQRSYRN